MDDLDGAIGITGHRGDKGPPGEPAVCSKRQDLEDAADIWRTNEGVENNVMLLDGFDEALMGHIVLDDQFKAIYSEQRIIKVFMSGADPMTYEEAREFYDFNTVRTISYLGAGAPIIMQEVGEE
jgi:hypothetical protein|tara:strand:- start:15631 stop:16002 length:372 start_codon:yes stop_codon:yes gene_type:complete